MITSPQASASRRPRRACAILVSEDSDMAKPTIGFIGAGHIGSQVARLAVFCGDPVVIGNLRGPDKLGSAVGEIGAWAGAGAAGGGATPGGILRGQHPLHN